MEVSKFAIKSFAAIMELIFEGIQENIYIPPTLGISVKILYLITVVPWTVLTTKVYHGHLMSNVASFPFPFC